MDGHEWVMTANVAGMSPYADQGRMTMTRTLRQLDRLDDLPTVLAQEGERGSRAL